MLPSHRGSVSSSLPPIRRLALFLVLGLLAITALNVIPGLFSRSAAEEKLLMEAELRRVEDELKVTSQQLNALKQAASRPGGSDFVHEKDQNEQTEEQRNLDIVSHQQLQAAKDEVLQLEAELRRVKQSHAEEVEKKKEADIPEVFGTRVNARFMKSEYKKDSPEYQKVTYKATTVNSDNNELIVLTSIAGSDSYGENRKFGDFMDTIKSIEFERTMSTLGLLVGSRDEYANIIEYLDANEDITFFSKVIVIQSQFLEDVYTVARDDRHSENLQKERRRAISRARNFLITNSLGDETYSLCMDADMYKTPEDMLRVFVNSGKDIIVPRVRQGGADNYDFNSWKGKRLKPTPEESEKLDNDPDFLFVPRPDGALHMHDFAFDDSRNDNKRDYSVPLDSVGGAVLFVKSEIFKQGALFPPFYLIGSTWERFEGYDGIETEGLCYQARTIGYSCWGFPNVVAVHAFDQ